MVLAISPRRPALPISVGRCGAGRGRVPWRSPVVRRLRRGGTRAARQRHALAREVDALNLAERCRTHIAAMSIPVEDDAGSGPLVKVTISVGVAALDGASCELTGSVAAADAALYQGHGP